MPKGYVTFWSKDYVKQVQKAGDKGPLTVVYGSSHTKMPNIAAVREGDIIYPVAILQGTLCVMARLKVQKIERAFDYLMRETGQRHAALIPDGVLMLSEGLYGEFACYADGSGYVDDDFDGPESCRAHIPDNIHTTIREDELEPKPHLFHQEPMTCCAYLAASGEGTEIRPRPIDKELVSTLTFRNTEKTEKPLRLDKNGCPRSISLSGFVRKASDETAQIFESLF